MAKNYVKDVYVLAQPFLEDESNLGTEVHLKFGDIKYVDENVQADDMCGRQGSNNMSDQESNRYGTGFTCNFRNRIVMKF